MVRACACEAFQKLSFTVTGWRGKPVYNGVCGLSALFGPVWNLHRTFTQMDASLKLAQNCLKPAPTSPLAVV